MNSVDDAQPDKSNLPRFLLVDDNRMNIKLAKSVFGKKGYELVGCLSGLQALETYSRSLELAEDSPRRFKLIFMGIHMSELDGFQTTEQLRNIEKKMGAEPIPIVAMTGSTSDDEKTKCRNIGMADFINKPLKMDQIENIIKKLLIH